MIEVQLTAVRRLPQDECRDRKAEDSMRKTSHRLELRNSLIVEGSG